MERDEKDELKAWQEGFWAVEEFDEAADSYSEQLELVEERLHDSGDADLGFEISNYPVGGIYEFAEWDIDDAMEFDEALAKLAFGKLSEQEKSAMKSKFGITDSMVLKEQLEKNPEIFGELDFFDELEIEQEMYLSDRELYGYENW